MREPTNTNDWTPSPEVVKKVLEGEPPETRRRTEQGRENPVTSNWVFLRFVKSETLEPLLLGSLIHGIIDDWGARRP